MLVIIVGGIPIAMPTVLSVTLALGAFKLAKEGAIVARMSAVEEMAGQLTVTMLVPASCVAAAVAHINGSKMTHDLKADGAELLRQLWLSPLPACWHYLPVPGKWGN